MQAETFERNDVMYKIGDLVMYGATGVCRVEAVSEEKFSLEELQMYYVLQPLYQNGRIYAPVENSKVYMRHIISEDDANELIPALGWAAPPVLPANATISSRCPI